MLDIDLPCDNLFEQLCKDGLSHGSEYLEGYRWGNNGQTADTRIRRSYVTYPVVETIEGGTENWRGKVRGGRKVFRSDLEGARRRWLLETWDKKSAYRPLPRSDRKENPRICFDDEELGQLLDELGNRPTHSRPSWIARGTPQGPEVRPHADPPPHLRVVEMSPADRPADAHFRERLARFADKHALPSTLVGLSWRIGSTNTFWDRQMLDQAIASGSFPGAQYDCCITEYIKCAADRAGSWVFSSEFWIEECRFDGLLSHVVVHNQGSLMSRLKSVFNPKSSSSTGYAFPAEHVEWRELKY